MKSHLKINNFALFTSTKRKWSRFSRFFKEKVDIPFYRSVHLWSVIDINVLREYAWKNIQQE